MTVDYQKGLTKEEVQERITAGKRNVAVDSNSRTVSDIVRKNVFTYFNLIFTVLAVLLIIAGSFRDLTFLPVIIANTLIGIIQEVRAKKVIDNLTMLNVPQVTVVRDGEETSIAPDQLVVDDIVKFQAGNQICADAVVCAGSVQVNESLLTGESDEILKERGSTLMSGSFIVSGDCYARLDKVGEESYISKLTMQAKKMQDGEQSEMIRSLDKLVQVVGIAIIPIGILLFVMSFVVREEGFQESVVSMVAAVIGMIPEGLYLLASVALVVSTMRLAKKKVLLHDMKCIETLARVNVLCVDKTGTITENTMEVQGVIPTSLYLRKKGITSTEEFDLEWNDSDEDEAGSGSSSQMRIDKTEENSGDSPQERRNKKNKKNRTGKNRAKNARMKAGYEEEEEETFMQPAKPVVDRKEEILSELKLLLGDFASAMSSDNITMAAIKKYFRKKSGKYPVSKTGFSSVTKYSSVTFQDGAYVLGAPEFVLKEKYSQYEQEILKYASRGARVLVFGQYDTTVDGGELLHGIDPLGYVLLANPIRAAAKETFHYFAEQGVEIKVISGDNLVTVAEVARQAGIKGAENFVDASTLETDEELREAILNYTVFGRVKPEQKRKFVNLLKYAGNTVAMTGDGVNDILALKDADCSIAMASGSEAAAQSAKLVLLDSDFSCMPDVVYEGRRVVNNIQRSASLFLVKNIFSLILSIFTMVIMMSYPLKPSQISLISLFTIGLPGFFLALESNKSIIKGKFIPNVLVKALPAAITDSLAVGALVVFGRTFDIDANDISVASTILMAIVGFMILYKISAPMNRFRISILLGCIAGLIFCSFYLSHLFAMSDMSSKCIMLCVVFSIAIESLFRYLSMLVELVQKMYGRMKKRYRNVF